MADLVLRGLDDELVRLVRVRSVESGKTVKQWVVPILEEAANGLGEGKGNQSGDSGISNETSAGARSDSGVAGVEPGGNGKEAARKRDFYHEPKHSLLGDRDTVQVDGGESCPDCGKELILNRVLRRMVCECGYQGKVRK
jgi:hypothetical protein